MPEGKPQYPTKREMLRHAYLTAKQVFRDPSPATQTLQEKRMKVCYQCDQYDPQQQRCMKCGCYLVAKAYVNGSQCPLGKWEGID